MVDEAEIPSERDLAKAIAQATAMAYDELTRSTGEDFYYCSLITDGEGHAPFLVAWSRQALQRAVETRDKPERWRALLKWSYADSPYCDFGSAHFAHVRELFDRRPPVDASAAGNSWMQEVDTRLRAMESAMRALDERGIFGRGTARANIVINAEVMPPDAGNTDRAKRLNPPEALVSWLDEAAEE